MFFKDHLIAALKLPRLSCCYYYYDQLYSPKVRGDVFLWKLTTGHLIVFHRGFNIY